MGVKNVRVIECGFYGYLGLVVFFSFDFGNYDEFGVCIDVLYGVGYVNVVWIEELEFYVVWWWG